ncbi:MAG TPA: permease-like cell division protein FtsX [Gammaproteobacteria bacterium]|nr:permease-like cell division protein FtsX [Gammaproteobacteria bacterium]
MKKPARVQGARRRPPPGWGWIRGWLLRHAQTALSSLGRLYRAPAASLMTAAVIGIALALPAGLYLLVDNLRDLGQRWDGNASLSLFLQQDLPENRARQLAETLRGWPEIGAVQFISPEDALAEFRALSGFGDALDALDDNPLPAVLTVRPAISQVEAEQIGQLQEKLAALPEVDQAQLDLQWVQRFAAMLQIVQRGILLVGGLLALAVLLIVGNTIRLDIFNRREEIEVSKLIGATNAFIRRPFLYSGLWYGLLGAALAWLLVVLAFWQLRGPVRQLAGLYQSEFALATFGFGTTLALLLLGILLGLAGSWLAVGRHLSAIQPR